MVCRAIALRHGNLGSYLKELNVTSRLEQDRATSRMELLFKSTSRNSLNQFASLSMALAEVRASRGQVR